MPQPEPFDPLEFLKVAEELAASGGEHRLRAAIGRAYYALFLLAKDRRGEHPRMKNRARARWLVGRLLPMLPSI